MYASSSTLRLVLTSDDKKLLSLALTTQSCLWDFNSHLSSHLSSTSLYVSLLIQFFCLLLLAGLGTDSEELLKGAFTFVHISSSSSQFVIPSVLYLNLPYTLLQSSDPSTSWRQTGFHLRHYSCSSSSAIGRQSVADGRNQRLRLEMLSIDDAGSPLFIDHDVVDQSGCGWYHPHSTFSDSHTHNQFTFCCLKYLFVNTRLVTLHNCVGCSPLSLSLSINQSIKQCIICIGSQANQRQGLDVTEPRFSERKPSQTIVS